MVSHESCIPCRPSQFHVCISPDLIPDWHKEVVPTADIKVAKEFSKKDFLTPSLIAEIQSLYPSRNCIDIKNNHARSKSVFAQNCEHLFPVNRVFLNREQFAQAARMFCAKWAIQCRHESKAIRCFFQDDKRIRRQEPVIGRAARKSNKHELKKKFNCPFIIRYRFVNYCKKKTRKFMIFFIMQR